MNNHDYAEEIEPRPIAILTAIAIVLGILIDRVFLLFAALFAVIAPVSCLMEWLHKHAQRTALPGHPEDRSL